MEKTKTLLKNEQQTQEDVSTAEMQSENTGQGQSGSAKKKHKISRESKIKLLKTQFIEILSETANTTIAAKAVGIAKATAYNYRKKDIKFALQWDEALVIASDKLAEEARRRAVEGVEKKVYFQGKLVAVEKTYSDNLLTQLLNMSMQAKVKLQEDLAQYKEENKKDSPAKKKLIAFVQGLHQQVYDLTRENEELRKNGIPSSAETL